MRGSSRNYFLNFPNNFAPNQAKISSNKSKECKNKNIKINEEICKQVL
jgi:hypothetical protein